VYLLQKFL